MLINNRLWISIVFFLVIYSFNHKHDASWCFDVWMLVKIVSMMDDDDDECAFVGKTNTFNIRKANIKLKQRSNRKECYSILSLMLLPIWMVKLCFVGTCSNRNCYKIFHWIEFINGIYPTNQLQTIMNRIENFFGKISFNILILIVLIIFFLFFISSILSEYDFEDNPDVKSSCLNWFCL